MPAYSSFEDTRASFISRSRKLKLEHATSRSGNRALTNLSIYEWTIVAPSSDDENPFLRWRRNERTITFDVSFYGYLEVARARANHLINFPVVKIIYSRIIFLHHIYTLYAIVRSNWYLNIIALKICFSVRNIYTANILMNKVYINTETWEKANLSFHLTASF